MNAETFNFTVQNFNKSEPVIPKYEIITVHQISLFSVIVMFFLYLGIHIFLGIMIKNRENIINKTEKDIKEIKRLKFYFKWWPAIYLLIILLQYAL